MNIGAAATLTGVSAKMIRHYEAIGLIRPATRSTSGYRLYSESDVHTLRFIRRARDLGFSTDRIRALLSLWRDRRRSSENVKRIALEHVAELEARQRDLEQMAQTLRHLSEHCSGDERPHCPIIDDLAGATVARDLDR